MIADLIGLKIGASGFAVCRAYVIQGGSPGEDRFSKMLYHKGFDIKAKSIAGAPSGLRGSDWDAGITADIIGEVDDWDTLVLFGGDSDYTHAAELVKDKGKQFRLYSFLGSTSRMLINMADHYVELNASNCIDRRGGHGR